jgi:predicted nucleic acid-binding protein
MMNIDPAKKIILDADVIIHFSKGGQLGILPQIFPNKIYVPDVVYLESLSQEYKNQVNNLFNYKWVNSLEIKAELNVLREYKRLVNLKFGKGESACLAYCRFHHDVIGSSNLKDIRLYCEENNIDYLTTMDFLAEAYRTGKLDEAACDFFIYNVKLKGSKLPCNSIAEYLNLK